SDDKCQGRPMYGCREDDDSVFGWTYDSNHGQCWKGSYCKHRRQPSNYFASQQECRNTCGA
uniref:Disagregin n=1 Tax=Ornithodoros moubata TaxID=6938 RepID=KUNPG_ORNMO|nr:RecName: Full=Disagregin; AltName: Full=Antihemostatic agent; AltName: Full=Platelet aggregation inhibitor; Short=PAI [Ornithodoros moubata]AAB30092.1 disagregin=fibrinogen receptor antagonist [Ornithodoros moubata=tick, salivary gland, Peptide, 60 aa] [Ornithodoros moubata]